MTVNLVISKTFLGAQVSDVLAGAGVGVDIGQVVNGKYVPIINQVANTGHQDIYVRHDAAVDQITDVKTHIAEYSAGAYGGADSAANDYATLITKGTADTEDTANNSNGTASGFRIEHNGLGIAGLGASAFLPSRGQVDIYGNSGTDGIDLASAFDAHVDAMVYDSGGETDAIAPVTGQIGKAADANLGEAMHVGLRLYLEQAATNGGIIQWDWVVAYSFTA